MRSYDWWESRRHPIRWTVYVGRAGEGKHRHRLRVDRLDTRTNKLRMWVLFR
jgi:hypothetical protein